MLTIIPWDVVFILINLIVLYIIMRKVLIKPIQNVIEKRESIINSGLQNAAVSEENAKALEKEWKDKLSAVNESSAEMMEKARKDAQNEYEKLMAEADAKAAKIVSDARRSMEDERNKAMEDIQSQIAGIAIDTARKVLETSDLKSVNNSLYDKFLTESGDGNDSEGK